MIQFSIRIQDLLATLLSNQLLRARHSSLRSLSHLLVPQEKDPITPCIWFCNVTAGERCASTMDCQEKCPTPSESEGEKGGGMLLRIIVSTYIGPSNLRAIRKRRAPEKKKNDSSSTLFRPARLKLVACLASKVIQQSNNDDSSNALHAHTTVIP